MVRQHWIDTIMTEYNGKLPPITVLQQQILNIPDDLTRMFCILSYLTGGRISEITNYEQEHIIRKARRNRKKQIVKNSAGETVYDKIIRNKKEIKKFPGLMKKNVVKELLKVKDINGKENTIEVLTIAMRNEKNKKKHHKVIHAPIYFEKELVDCLFTYLNTLDDDEVIINVSRRSMYNHFIKYAKQLYYPHFIRALRVGVLIEVYGMSPTAVQDLMGWSNLKPLEAYYIFKKDNVILNTFIRRIEEAKS